MMLHRRVSTSFEKHVPPWIHSRMKDLRPSCKKKQQKTNVISLQGLHCLQLGQLVKYKKSLKTKKHETRNIDFKIKLSNIYNIYTQLVSALNTQSYSHLIR